MKVRVDATKGYARGALTVLFAAILKPYTLTDTTVQEMITKHMKE